MRGVVEKQLIECLRAKTTRTKTPVLAIIVGVPMVSVSPYLNPHISAVLWRMKTTKQPCFKLTSRRFVFRFQFFFFAFIFTSNSHDGVMITSPQQASSWSSRWILKHFWDRQTFAKIELSLKSNCPCTVHFCKTKCMVSRYHLNLWTHTQTKS
jgi:hypothetical protein